MSESNPLQIDEEELQTPFVFVDTQAYVQHRFEWQGAAFKKLSEFGKSGVLRLLTTDITKREVQSNLLEAATEARDRLAKFGPILDQLDVPRPLDELSDAHAALCKKFDEFLKSVKAIELQAPTDAKGILDDYFARKPPFGLGKKKSEFPDAFVVAALKEWCKKSGNIAYVISRDPDWLSCCSPKGPLVHLGSIQELLSLAVVKHDIRQKLISAVTGNASLVESISRKLADFKLAQRYGTDLELDDTSVDNVSVLNVNILDNKGSYFLVEIEVEAVLSGEVRYEVTDHVMTFRGEDIQRGTGYASFNSPQYVYAEVELNFDVSDPDSLEMESVSIFPTEFEVELDRFSRRNSASLPREVRITIR